MKKVFLSLAVVAMFSFVACGGNGEATDSTAQEPTQIDEPAQEPVQDEETMNVGDMAEDATAETESEVDE